MKIPPLVSLDTDTGKLELVESPPAGTDFIVVMRFSVPLIAPDNLVGVCAACGQGVQFRPENAACAAPKVCMACVPAWVAGMEASQ
jgi:hypothetical protein